MSQEYTNISDLPTMAEVTSPAYVPVEDTNKQGKKVDLSNYYTKSQTDSGFVSSTGYVATDNNYTTAEKNKLDGIETGAQVNVKPDWEAESGSDAEILNKPDIPTVGTLNTSNTTAESVNESESLTGTVNLHKVSKTGSYTDLLNKPSIPKVGTLNTNHVNAQSVVGSESFSNTIHLHKVSKTGTYGDLLDKPILKTSNTTGLSPSNNETISGTINLHKVAKTGSYVDLLDSPDIDKIWSAIEDINFFLNKNNISIQVDATFDDTVSIGDSIWKKTPVKLTISPQFLGHTIDELEWTDSEGYCQYSPYIGKLLQNYETDIIPSGWHLPTEAEAIELGNCMVYGPWHDTRIDYDDYLHIPRLVAYEYNDGEYYYKPDSYNFVEKKLQSTIEGYYSTCSYIWMNTDNENNDDGIQICDEVYYDYDYESLDGDYSSIYPVTGFTDSVNGAYVYLVQNAQ